MGWYIYSLQGEEQTKIDEFIYEQELRQLPWAHMSGPFATEQDALASLAHESGQPPTRCSHCGGWISFCYLNWRSLLRRTACFMCNLWLGRIEAMERTNPIVIDGHCYSDAGRSNERNKSFLGFGGAEFHIRMNDGRIIHTNNLWHGGKIPERWREKLPDNATFLNDTKWVKAGGEWVMDNPA